MAKLPFENTEVPSERSIGAAIGLLVESGFEKVGQIIAEGETQILAQYRGASFIWSPKCDLVYKAVTNQKRGRYDSVDMKNRARRMAWRLIYFEIKAATDSVKYQAASVAEVFGGRLMVQDHTGKPRFYAELITEAIEIGQMSKLPLLGYQKD